MIQIGNDYSYYSLKILFNSLLNILFNSLLRTYRTSWRNVTLNTVHFLCLNCHCLEGTATFGGIATFGGGGSLLSEGPLFSEFYGMTMLHKYLHLVKADLLFAESTSFQSTLASFFQVLSKISLLYQQATLWMYTGDFKELAAVSVALYEQNNRNLLFACLCLFEFSTGSSVKGTLLYGGVKGQVWCSETFGRLVSGLGSLQQQLLTKASLECYRFLFSFLPENAGKR